MKILFMGTPEFAVPPLLKLIQDGHEICGVICQPDKPKGRGMKLTPPPVKQCALENNIPVYQPEKLKDNAILPLLRELSPELIVVVAYGKILPDYILEFPKLGAVNLHGSLLPKYRGAAPIQRSVMDGCELVGVTTMYMASRLDAGDIILQKAERLNVGETSGEVFERLSHLGAELLSETVSLIEKGCAPRIPQNEAEATFAPMLSKEEGLINWSLPAKKIAALICGLDPWPTAYSFIDGKKINLFKATVFGAGTQQNICGKILSCEKDGVVISCGEGAVKVAEVKAEGGKRMPAADFFRGHQKLIGECFKNIT